MKMLNKIIFLSILILCGTYALIAQEVSASLENNSIRIGEQTSIQIEVSFPIGVSQVLLPSIKDTLSKEIDVVEVGKVDTVFDESDLKTKIFSQKITITSWDTGYQVIPPFIFVVGKDSLKTNPLLLAVSSIAISAEQDIKDIKSIVEVPFSLWDWILVHLLEIGIVLLIIGLLIVAFYAVRYYRNKKPIEEEVVPKEAADLVALRKLKDLEAQKLWQNNKIKEYHSNLSFILREYLKNRFEFNALEIPSDELLMILSIKLKSDKKMLGLIQETLYLSDLTKYAKQQPVASENEAAIKNARQIIEKTAFHEEEKTDAGELKAENNLKIEEKDA